jgi:hypothetical protein
MRFPQFSFGKRLGSAWMRFDICRVSAQPRITHGRGPQGHSEETKLMIRGSSEILNELFSFTRREWYGLTPSRTRVFLNPPGYLGLKIVWGEGIELNLLSGVIGIDVRRPAIKLPAVGRLGIQLSP